jgi:hypothetical protein
MNLRRNRRSFRPSLDVLQSRITPSGLTLRPVVAMDVPVNPVVGIYDTGVLPNGIEFSPVPLPPSDGPCLPEYEGPVTPMPEDPLAPLMPTSVD